MTTTAATVATSRALLEACAVSAWRPAASAIAATNAFDAGQQMEGGDLRAGSISCVGVDEPEERPDDGQPECHGIDGCDPSRHRDP